MAATSRARDVPHAAMLDVNQFAALLGCSTRHIYRLAADGRAPRPVRLGVLVRWSRAVVEEWIKSGCQSCDCRSSDPTLVGN